ncbi:four helix bundle protein [Fibrella forsythiae]|uniref:Four helix bundle protein n=1 Tax=Fibrella forsythiae TaxID=2817061 RepID=A0ABS3JKF6_9BACT|nr:four helix bundle protein [Fibrella forsythiae]MBO0949709.1 four helix bundle protein [Fibrella forsythiae]
MATIRRFEDLLCWQKSRELCSLIYTMTKAPQFASDFSLIDQIRRSSGSVMDNIAEGYERDGAKELVHFLSIDKGSLGEVRSQLYRALDQQYISQTEFNVAYNLTLETIRIISGFMSYVRTSGYKGTKFKVEEQPLSYSLL